MDDFELKFDPKTIEHLGVKMYATLPPALAELISNAYDADANEVTIQFFEQNGTPKSITVIDNGCGMSSKEIQSKFLVIGRNRRKDEGDGPTPIFKRLPTGKKGLGKLALFGLAKKITVDTAHEKLRNRFSLDWDNLLSAEGTYNPESDLRDSSVDKKNGTIIKLSELKRKSPFDLEAISDSLSRIFIVDDDFKIILKKNNGDPVFVTNERRYSQIKSQFEWSKDELIDESDKYYSLIDFRFITAETPIPPASGARGVTLFSRGKLVNAPEYFSSSTSSHFFQYLTGWIKADFIDLLDEDVISTNRQSVNWDHPEMLEFRLFLSQLIAKVNLSWRKKRSDKKDKDFTVSTGIDKQKWYATLPKDIKDSVEKIVDTMSNDEGVSASYEPVIQALHSIVPEYPHLHWRHLNKDLQVRVESYYKNGQYGEAADQGAKIYCDHIRSLTSLVSDGTDLTGAVFGGKAPVIVVSNQGTETGRNIQAGQEALSRGLIVGFRNPVSHAPIDALVPKIFSELDCLNILSLVSYLMTRLEKAEIKVGVSSG